MPRPVLLPWPKSFGLHGQLLGLSNPKILKGVKAGFPYLTAILHLAPHKRAGRDNVCTSASKGCIAACLNLAGRGGVIPGGATIRQNTVQVARVRRTHLLFDAPATFESLLLAEVRKAVTYARRYGTEIAGGGHQMSAVIRLNGTSDIRWEDVPMGGQANIFACFPQTQFYDYTKHVDRMARRMPANYDLTFSISEENQRDAKRLLGRGVRCAGVFTELPDRFWNAPVIAGDDTDLRFLEPGGVIVGLTPKVGGRRQKQKLEEWRRGGFLLNPPEEDAENAEPPQRDYARSQVVFDPLRGGFHVGPTFVFDPDIIGGEYASDEDTTPEDDVDDGFPD